MKTIFRVFSFSLCATSVIFTPTQSRGADAFATLAAITPRVTSGASSIFQHVIQNQLYFKCVRSHGQEAASGANAAAQAGTFITNSGTFITFDPPGSTFTSVRSMSPAGAITGSTRPELPWVPAEPMTYTGVGRGTGREYG